jgi:hypothetical protein
MKAFLARDYGIDLVIWGESAAESSSRGTYEKPLFDFDQDYFLKMSAKVKAEEFEDDDISLQELKKFNSLSAEDYAEAEIKGIHLGDYLFWDEERQTEFVIKEYGWREDEVEGTYKRYNSTECIMPGVHDIACYLKRGYGRASFHLSSDIRAGLVSRDEIEPSILDIERTLPRGFEYFSEITGIDLNEFVNLIDTHKQVELKGKSLPILEMDKTLPKKRLFIEDLKDWIDRDARN